MADQNLYIRERIFDMWIGDWNKTNENWEWQSHTVNDSVIYTPIVIDRNHAFTKVDGVLFKQMLKMLSLDFICNYDSLILKDTKKINKLAFALDMAVAGRSDESVWIRQAQEIRKQMTDSLIDSAFTYLPEGVKHDEIEVETEEARTGSGCLPILSLIATYASGCRNQSIRLFLDRAASAGPNYFTDL